MSEGAETRQRRAFCTSYLRSIAAPILAQDGRALQRAACAISTQLGYRPEEAQATN